LASEAETSARLHTIYREIPRVAEGLLDSIRGFSVADLNDALPPPAHDASLLPRSLQPLIPGALICGQAVTAYSASGDGLISHCALYLARRGDVLVIASDDCSRAVWGGAVSFDAKTLGLAGVVVYGAVRDVAAIREMGLPTWMRSASASRAEKKGQGCINTPISCGSTVIHPGDIVVADDDGVMAFSPSHIGALVDQARRKRDSEHAMRKRVEDGERLFEVARFDELLASNGIEIKDGCWTPESIRV
jgi:4-hydroxy-4-methyl-2-oxoglutarate aldolase